MPAGRPPSPLDPDASLAVAFGAEVRERRLAAGLTLTGLAALVGYSAQHVSDAEHAKASISNHFAAALDAALDAEGALLALYPAVAAEREAERQIRSKRGGRAVPLRT